MMEVKLIKTGGLLGKKMSASREWGFSEKEWEELIRAVEKKDKESKRIPDATHYVLQKEDGDEIKLDISSIPSKYQPFFKKMFEDLKVEKR
jgi:hypothetical protein